MNCVPHEGVKVPVLSSVHGVFHSRILERVAISPFRGSSRPRDRARVSRFAGRFFTAEPLGKLVSPERSLIWKQSCRRGAGSRRRHSDTGRAQADVTGVLIEGTRCEGADGHSRRTAREGGSDASTSQGTPGSSERHLEQVLPGAFSRA